MRISPIEQINVKRLSNLTSAITRPKCSLNLFTRRKWCFSADEILWMNETTEIYAGRFCGNGLMPGEFYAGSTCIPPVIKKRDKVKRQEFRGVLNAKERLGNDKLFLSDRDS